MSTVRGAAAAASPPLRTLVYDVSLSIVTTTQERTADAHRSVVARGSATTEHSTLTTDRGKLTVNVVTASEDGRLIVDATFAGSSPRPATIRVAISKSGELFGEPNTPVNAASAAVLPLLGRGLLDGRDVSPGSTWDVSPPGTSTGTITYRVVHTDRDLADFTITAQVSTRGPAGFDLQTNAKAAYDMVRLCPIHYDITNVLRSEPNPSSYVTATTHIVADLVTDTFANRKRP